MLDTIPNEELLEICKRARSIENASSKKLDIELSSVECHDIVDKKRCHDIVEFVL
jgi:hypothetical protein